MYLDFRGGNTGLFLGWRERFPGRRKKYWPSSALPNAGSKKQAIPAGENTPRWIHCRRFPGGPASRAEEEALAPRLSTKGFLSKACRSQARRLERVLQEIAGSTSNGRVGLGADAEFSILAGPHYGSNDQKM